jgi:hypothetical protein
MDAPRASAPGQARDPARPKERVERPVNRSRTNHPLKTLFLLAVLGGAAWAGYEFLWVRKILSPAPAAPVLTEEEQASIRDAILTGMEDEDCFVELGSMNLRPHEGIWRIDVVVEDACWSEARSLCRKVADIVEQRFRVPASVFAYDRAAHEVAHYVP